MTHPPTFGFDLILKSKRRGFYVPGKYFEGTHQFVFSQSVILLLYLIPFVPMSPVFIKEINFIFVKRIVCYIRVDTFSQAE